MDTYQHLFCPMNEPLPANFTQGQSWDRSDQFTLTLAEHLDQPFALNVDWHLKHMDKDVFDVQVHAQSF